MLMNLHKPELPAEVEEDLTPLDLRKCIEKTRRNLEIAYAGFNNAVDVELIDSYIYEINSLQKRYNHLTKIAAEEAQKEPSLRQYSPIRTLVSHVLG